MKNLFLSIFEISISTSLVVVILLMLAPLLNRRYASKWKYYIWIALALRLVIPFNLNLLFRQVVINIPSKMASPIITNNGNNIPITLQTVQKFKEITLLDFIAVIWLVVCLCFLFVHIFSFLHYKKQIIKKGAYVENNFILCQLLRLQKNLQIKAKISIIKCSEAVSPMMIGFFRPVLVLPDNEYTHKELFFILKHELIHLKRHDIYFKLLFVITTAIHWFNPFIYIMRKEASIDMELACDEKVIEGTAYAFRKAYTQTLLSTLHKQYKKAAALTTQFYGGNQIMKKRFKNILLNSKKKNGFSFLVCIVTITLVLGMITGCSVIEPTSSEIQPNNKFSSQEPKDNGSLSKESTDNTNMQTVPAKTSRPKESDPDNTKELKEILSDDSQEPKDNGSLRKGSADNTNMQTVPAKTSKPKESDPDSTKELKEILSDDSQEIKTIAENFAAAYFSGDIDTIQTYLTNPYKWDIEVYTGTGSISELTLKGLEDISKAEAKNTQVISLEYRDSDYKDTLKYLTLQFVKQKDSWKIQFYGLEG